MAKRILVPVDFSDSSLQALDYAIEMGRVLKAEFLILHVVEPVFYAAPSSMYGGGYDASIIYQELERTGREQLSRLAADLHRRRLRVRTLLSVGAAHRAIVDTAKKLKSDLIVMSTHGRTGLAHALIGSVAERVVRTAACPVLTVRARPGRASRKRVGRRTSPAADSHR